ALLTSCMGRIFFPALGNSAANLLRAAGFRVVELRGFGCCGAPYRESGERDKLRRQAQRLLDAVAEAERDGPLTALVTDSALCAVTLEGYERLFSKESPQAAQARSLGERIRELSLFLDEQGVASRLSWGDPGVGRVAFHDHCQSRHGFNVHLQPRRLLAALPVERAAWPEPQLCCGAGGTYMLRLPQRSEAIREFKLQALEPDDATWITGTNPGCLMHLAAGKSGPNPSAPSPRVLPLAELLWQSHQAADSPQTPPLSPTSGDE
ncbi:MAG: (Fe-S)-binding protein, partial [Magnetococcales bacterium]|nr:(Fe-S)-binding protein [Magnetococcales bacterium]